MIQQKEVPTTESESPATDKGLASPVARHAKLDSLPRTEDRDSEQGVQESDATFNWRVMENDVTQMRQELDEEKRVRNIKKTELREKERVLINTLQKTISDEQEARTRLKEELRENEMVLTELQTMLDEELRESTRVDEELSQAKIASIKLEERLQNELAQMRKTLDDKESVVEELQRTLEEEQQAKIAVHEELRKTRIACTKQEVTCIKQKKGFQNDLAQIRRTLDEEVRLRNMREQELRDKERNVDELQRALEEEQQARGKIDNELRQTRIYCYETTQKFVQMQRAFDDKERTVGELQSAVEEGQRVRAAMDEELRENRLLCNYLQERLVDERLSNQQELQTKDNAIREQQTRLGEEHRQKTALEERLRSLELQMEEQRNRHESTVRQLQSAVSAAEENQRVLSRDWIIQRDEVVLSENILGRGGWGIVREGRFRGCQVAVKEIYDVILSDHNRRLFEREMTIASRCRHPNLLQFIGATNDVGSPLFVTEILDTSLRHLLSSRALNHAETVNLALDIAKGLNYLHLSRPLPIVHRDISSANVLLWRREQSWRAKLSDYGAANFMRQCMTENPGAVIYSAPEASRTSQHSPKVRVGTIMYLSFQRRIQEWDCRGGGGQFPPLTICLSCVDRKNMIAAV